MKAISSDLTLHALGRLPASEAHELESKLAADPALASELRELEDRITEVWHAASPLLPAPAGCFEAVRARLHPVRHRPGLTAGLAAVGWAAAIALAATLLLKNPPPTAGTTRPPATDPRTNPSILDAPADQPPPVPSQPDSNPQRSTIRRLQQELAIARQNGAGPRIHSLRPPGSRGNPPPADQARELNALLTSALAEHLARQSEVPSSLTVETGWLETLFAALPADALIRHRAFPVENFGDYGLLRSEDGDFYDPEAHMVWSPADDGGGYLGRVVAVDYNPVGFQAAPPETPTKKPAVEPKAEPTGYLVQTGTGSDATVIIGNLPLTGETPQLVASTDGGQTTTSLSGGSLWLGANNTGFATFNLPNGLLGNFSNLTIYQPSSDGTLMPILTGSP